jgi:hypothetical protein
VLEPSADDTTRLLLEALANLPKLRREARGFAASVRAAYSWDAAAASLEQLAFAAMGQRRVPVPAEPLVELPAMEPRVTAPEPEPVVA